MADIYIYGDIWYQDATWFLSEMLRAKGQDVTICINSDGGDVFEAAAMFGAILRHDAKVTCRVDGIAASAAAYLCMAADEVVMSPSSFMMIHLPWTVAIGNRDDLEAVRRDLMVVEEAMVAAHVAKSGKSPDEIRSMFEEETLMGADRAVEEGFADRVEGAAGAEDLDEGTARERSAAGAAKSTERVVARLSSNEQTALFQRNMAAIRSQSVASAGAALKVEDARSDRTPPVEVNIYNRLPTDGGQITNELPAGGRLVGEAPGESIVPAIEAGRRKPGEPPKNQPPESAEIESEEPPIKAASSCVQPDTQKETGMSVDLNALRAQRGEKAGAIRAMVFDSEDKVKNLSDQDKAAIEGMEKELIDIEARITIAERAEERVKALSVPVVEPSAITAPPQVKEEVSNTAQFGQYLQAFALGKGIRSEMVRIAASRWGERAPIVGVLNTTDDASVVPDPYANEIIELLRAESVVMAAGPRFVDLPNGRLSMPAGATGASASYTGEATNITASEPTFRQVLLEAKKLTSLVPISNEIKTDSVANLETWVREDIVASMGETADINFLRADGSGNLPTGLLNLAQAGALVAANATVNLANITNDLGAIELVLMNNNVRGGNHVWFMSPRSFIFLSDLRDGNGNLAFPTLTNGDTPTLRRKRVLVSSQIPDNLGAGTDESEVYLAAMNHVMIGEAGGLEIAVSEEASYFDGANLQSAFAQDLTLIRAITRHDIDIRQLFAVAVLQAVTWGV